MAKWSRVPSRCRFWIKSLIILSVPMDNNALSFYRSQNVLSWSKYFGHNQKLIYIFLPVPNILGHAKKDFRSVNLVFEWALNAIKFLDSLNKLSFCFIFCETNIQVHVIFWKLLVSGLWCFNITFIHISCLFL